MNCVSLNSKYFLPISQLNATDILLVHRSHQNYDKEQLDQSDLAKRSYHKGSHKCKGMRLASLAIHMNLLFYDSQDDAVVRLKSSLVF